MLRRCDHSDHAVGGSTFCRVHTVSISTINSQEPPFEIFITVALYSGYGRFRCCLQKDPFDWIFFWYITRRRFINIYRRFGQACCHHLQCLRSPRMEPVTLTYLEGVTNQHLLSPTVLFSDRTSSLGPWICGLLSRAVYFILRFTLPSVLTSNTNFSFHIFHYKTVWISDKGVSNNMPY